MTTYRARSRRRNRRWPLAPILVGGPGAVAAWVGAWLQIIGGGLNLWGFVTLGGVLLVTGALAWAQFDLTDRETER